MPILLPQALSLAYSVWNKRNGNNDLVLPYEQFLTAESALEVSCGT